MSEPGGVQEQVRGLARALSAAGEQVSLFGPELPSEDKISGVEMMSLGGAVRLPANGSVAPVGLDPRMLVRLELALDPADVLHVHEGFLPASLAATFRVPTGVPVVATFHAAAERFLPYRVAAPALRRFGRRFAAATAVSPSAAALVRRYTALNPQIVPNGFDTDAYASAAPDPWAAGLGRVVLFVGRPEPRKGFDVALRAFASVSARHPDVHLVCFPAPGSSAPDGLDRVHCLGRVDHQRKLALYAAAESVVVPSLHGESFGLVVVEAMAAGCAVLASDIPGYRFAGGDVPVYAAPGDAGAWADQLDLLLSGHKRRSELAERGPARAREFDWTNVGAAMSDVYRAVASG